MRAARREAQHCIAGRDAFAVDDLAFLDDADREAREIVFARRVHAGHFRGFTADQCASGLSATRGDAFDHLGRGCHVKLAAREVIEKEQRFRALHEYVVDAHRDEIDSHRATAPLRPAEDAIILNTGDLRADEVLDRVTQLAMKESD